MRKRKLFFLLHQFAKAASGAGISFSICNKQRLFHLVSSTKAVFTGGIGNASINSKKTYRLISL